MKADGCRGGAMGRVEANPGGSMGVQNIANTKQEPDWSPLASFLLFLSSSFFHQTNLDRFACFLLDSFSAPRCMEIKKEPKRGKVAQTFL